MFELMGFLILFYSVTNIAGYFIEKIRIPKIYAALFIGVLLSTTKPVLNVVSWEPVVFLAKAGMFSLLVFLGIHLDFEKIKSQKKLIFKVVTWMISAELIVGSTLLHYLFKIDWALAAFISFSFATVGEVALLPILKEFNLLHTDLGQSILGIGILDDVVEIASFIILLILMSGFSIQEFWNQLLPLLAIMLGYFARKCCPQKLEEYVSTISLVILGPIFFFYAGTEANLNIFVSKLPLIIFITLVIKATKLLSVYVASSKEIGLKKSIVMGISLSVKFSTSIIIITILLQKGLITAELFSVLIGIKVLFKFIVPVLLSFFLKKWKSDLKLT